MQSNITRLVSKTIIHFTNMSQRVLFNHKDVIKKTTKTAIKTISPEDQNSADSTKKHTNTVARVQIPLAIHEAFNGEMKRTARKFEAIQTAVLDSDQRGRFLHHHGAVAYVWGLWTKRRWKSGYHSQVS